MKFKVLDNREFERSSLSDAFARIQRGSASAWSVCRGMSYGRLGTFLTEQTSITPLVIFRILFGAVMLFSVIRFAANGWIETQYLEPTFFFTYYGFDWVKPFGVTGMYLLFALMGLSALMVMLGCFYRIFSVLFFLTFTYIELIDKTNYLNHYYFISIVSFLLTLVPAHRSFSLDVLRNPKLELTHIPGWMIFILQLQLGIVYFYAGIAKLNYDWLVNAQPMKIWLPSKSNLPVIGWLFEYVWVAYAFSWLGAFYDISIPFLLVFRRTRGFAYSLVIGFHLMTGMLFQIGMFPYIMILLTLIFFRAEVHEKILNNIKSAFKRTAVMLSLSKQGAGTRHPSTPLRVTATHGYALITVLAIHFLIQLLLPFRYALYPDNLFWTEEGYRFSWRVMLMEKAGTCFFYVTDPKTGGTDEVSPSEYLTKHQEKMMSTQPDMLLQFAHELETIYKQQGIENPEVRVESYVSLNGRGSRLFIDPQVNLVAQQESFRHKDWVLPFEESQRELALNREEKF